MSTPRSQVGRRKPPPGVRIRTDYLDSGQARHRVWVNGEPIGVFDTLKEAEKAGVKRLGELGEEGSGK